MSLPGIVRVDDVMARYGMRDERTARKLMNQIGAFRVAGRLVVHEDALAAWEVAQVRTNPSASPPPARRPSERRQDPAGQASPATGPDWWREPLGDNRAGSSR